MNTEQLWNEFEAEKKVLHAKFDELRRADESLANTSLHIVIQELQHLS